MMFSKALGFTHWRCRFWSTVCHLEGGQPCGHCHPQWTQVFKVIMHPKLSGPIFCGRQRLKVIRCTWETNQSTNYLQEGHDEDPTLTARNTRGTWTISTFYSFCPCEAQDLDVNTRTHKASVIQGSMELWWPTTQVWPRLRAFLGHQTPRVGHPSGDVQVITYTRTPGRQLALASV